ncbi:MAG: 5-formyltetrahydrofolate cyclo-ligase [Bacteroidaceae bacterium]
MNAMHDDKKQARQRIKRLVAVMTPESKAAQSAVIWERLEQTEAFRKATDILIYWSMDDEVQTPQFIEKWAGRKRFYLPSIQGDELVIKRYAGTTALTPGQSFSIPEPTGLPVSDLNSISLVIVPGRAFDNDGHRLGRGRGFYDRLLPQLPHAVKAGVCFDCQKLPCVPTDDNDIIMDFVI